MSDTLTVQASDLPAITNNLRTETLLRFELQRGALDQFLAISLDPDRPHRREAVFHRIEGFVELDDEEVLERTVSLLSGLATRQAPLVYWIHGDGRRYRILYGSLESKDGSAAGEDLLRHLRAFYQGSDIRPEHMHSTDEMREDLRGRHAVASLTGIPFEREATPVETRLDEALAGLASIPFDLVLVAQPQDPVTTEAHERNLFDLYNVIHRLTRQTISEGASKAFSESFSRSFNQTVTEGGSRSIADGISHSVAHSEGEAWEDRKGSHVAAGAAGTVIGMLAGGALGYAGGPLTMAAGAKIGAMVGGMASSGLIRMIDPPKTINRSTTTTDGTSRTETEGQSWSKALGWSESDTAGVTDQLSKQVSSEHVNREAMALERILDEHLERIREGRGLGMWNTSVHVATANPADLPVVCSVLEGALRGDRTHLEPMRWQRYQEPDRALRYLAALEAPRIGLPPSPVAPGFEQLPTRLTSHELAYWIRPVVRELPGFTLRPPIAFSRNLPDPERPDRAGRPTRTPGATLDLGTLVHRGEHIASERVAIEIRDLCGHALIAGSTDSGKTTTTKRLLWGLQQLDPPVPFMVLEPAKSEYGDLFDALERAGRRPVKLIAGVPGPQGLHIDPLQAPRGVPLGRHVDGIKVLLRSCFAMQEALPQLLERVLVDAYRQKGLGDFAGIYGDDAPECPTLADIAGKPERIAEIVKELGYHAMGKQGFTAALRVRVESLVSGLKGVVFQPESQRFEDLLERPVFIQLSDINEPDVRRLLMGTVLLRVYGAREAAWRRAAGDLQPTSASQRLRHLLVIEEAHRLVRRRGSQGPGTELIGEVNTLVSDALAELRAYGQGILVAEQSPSILAQAVIRNTNLKLVQRLFAADDCRAVGDAMGLDEEEQREFRRLRTGEAIQFGPGMVRPVHVAVEPIEFKE